jgi:hypothetical protein
MSWLKWCGATIHLYQGQQVLHHSSYLFGDEAITPEEAKAGSIRTVASVEDKANYSVAKDTIEGTILQTVENINKYQAETIK